eukprot:2096396-Amphidinium_carterae.1
MGIFVEISKGCCGKCFFLSLLVCLCAMPSASSWRGGVHTTYLLWVANVSHHGVARLPVLEQDQSVIALVLSDAVARQYLHFSRCERWEPRFHCSQP